MKWNSVPVNGASLSELEWISTSSLWNLNCLYNFSHFDIDEKSVQREMSFSGSQEGPGVKYKTSDVVEAPVEEIFLWSD